MAILEIDPSLAVFIGAALALVGLALAFWGRSIVARVMAMIGAVIGSILGLLVWGASDPCARRRVHRIPPLRKAREDWACPCDGTPRSGPRVRRVRHADGDRSRRHARSRRNPRPVPRVRGRVLLHRRNPRNRHRHHRRDPPRARRLPPPPPPIGGRGPRSG